MTLDPVRAQSDVEAYRASLAGVRAAVVGAGRSGLACVTVLAEAGATVVLADAKPADELPDVGADLLPGFERFDQLPAIDLMVISPGVPDDHPALAPARAAGVEVIGTMELAWRLCPAPVIAVSGTNGKGTCCRLLADMLGRGGVRNVLAGNIGDPLAGELPGISPDHVVVLEVSSFQLESVVDFRPRVAVLLNITPDHLDRHPDLDDYIGAKSRLFANQTPDDFAVANLDDPVASRLALASRAQPLTVSLERADASARVEGDGLVVELDGVAERVCGADDFTLPGAHHVTSVLSAAVVARLLGVASDAIGEAVGGYEAPAHHMERVAEVAGVVFYNDSKASNPSSAVADLSAMREPFVVIVGGKDKGADFSELGALLSRRPRGVILIGEAADRIARAMGEGADVERAPSLEEAMERALAIAEPGDAVIMAPACSSFDMFRDYSHRGDLFRQKAQQLQRQHSRH